METQRLSHQPQLLSSAQDPQLVAVQSHSPWYHFQSRESQEPRVGPDCCPIMHRLELAHHPHCPDAAPVHPPQLLLALAQGSPSVVTQRPLPPQTRPEQQSESSRHVWFAVRHMHRPSELHCMNPQQSRSLVHPLWTSEQHFSIPR